MSLVVPGSTPVSSRFDGDPSSSRRLVEAPVEIGGYRLVRRLGEGSAAVSWLARGGDESVVLRLYRDAVDDARIDVEIAARERLAGPHVPELLDLATGRDGRPVPIIAPVVGPLLVDVLARSTAPLRAGHATTLLAPLAALLDAAHEVGATLGRLDPRAIRIDPTGAPVVVSLGRACAAPPLPVRFRDREPAIVDDLAQFARLCAEIVAVVDAREQPSLRAAVERAAGSPAELELALFDAAAPLPLSSVLDADPDQTQPRSSAHAIGWSTSRSLAQERDVAAPVLGHRSRIGAAFGDAVGLLGLPESLVASARAVLGRASAAKGGVRPAWVQARTPRRGVVVVGVVGALALVAAIALGALEDRQASTAAPPVSGPAITSGEADSAVVENVAPDDIVEPSPEDWPVVVGALVDRWLACANESREGCEVGVVQSDSAAAELLSGSRGGAVDEAGALAAWAAGERTIIVVDRMGAAAVVDLIEGETATASLLVLRSEAGWRIRAVLT